MPAAERARRRPLATIVLALASVAVALGLLELAVRAAWPRVAPLREVQAERLAALVEEAKRLEAQGAGGAGRAGEDLPVLRTMADLTGRNVRGLFKGALYTTNSARFRGPEYTPRPEPGVFRIAITGDSITMGAGVADDETYAAQLQSLLNAASDGRRYEVLNLGLGGINLKRAVLRLERIGMRFHPHLVVYGFTPNDIEGEEYRSTYSEERVKRREARRRRLRELPFYLPRAVWPRLVQLRDLVAPPRGTYAYDLEQNYFHRPEAWQDFTRWLDRFAGIAEQAGICGHVLIHTQLVQLGRLHPFHDIYDRVARAARERGLGVTRPFDAFEGRNPADLWVSPLDSHPNPEGHALFARALHDDLRSLPARCLHPDGDRREAASR